MGGDGRPWLEQFPLGQIADEAPVCGEEVE